MKGTLHKTDNEWIVEYAEHEQLPLIPDDAKRYQNEYDYYGAIGFKGKEVDFEIVNIVTNKNTLSDDDIVLLGTYAKIINHISDISKMVVYTHDDVIKMMDTFHTSILNRDLCMAKLTPIELPQQETLYTEEQVRKLVEEANYDGQYLHAKSVTSRMMRDNAESYSNEIIQSLKQPKKD